jgi:hypothetical protein
VPLSVVAAVAATTAAMAQPTASTAVAAVPVGTEAVAAAVAVQMLHCYLAASVTVAVALVVDQKAAEPQLSAQRCLASLGSQHHLACSSPQTRGHCH